MKMWTCPTKIGVVKIVELQKGVYVARFKGEDGNCYDSPDAAADDFFTHHSGCDRWDRSSCEIPDGLGEWVCQDII